MSGERRGRLRVHLGVASGAGSTFRLLDEARRRAARGTDVLLVGPGDPPSTDLAALVIERRPDVAAIDALHLVNPAGSRRSRRYEDIAAVLDAGIDVVTATSADRMTSFRELHLVTTGRVHPEEFPDEFVRAADQIELVDITPEALRRRLAHGTLSDEVGVVEAARFSVAHLDAVREHALRWMTREHTRRRREGSGMPGPIVVGLTGTRAGQLALDRAIDLAERLDAPLLGAHVRPTDGLTSRAGPQLDEQRRRLAGAGGRYHELVHDDVAVALSGFATSERASHLVVGRVAESERRSSPSVTDRLVRVGTQVDLVLVPPGDATPRRRSPSLTRIGPKGGLSSRRRWSAWLACLAGLPLLTLGLTQLRGHVSLGTAVLLNLATVLAVAATGGLVPGLVASLLAFWLINWYFVPPFHTLHIAEVENVVTLVVFVSVASVVSVLVDRSARRSVQARRARAEAAALASTSAALVGSPTPLPELLGLLRSTFGIPAASVLTRANDAWTVEATSGDDPPRSPADGTSRALDGEGRTVLVLGGGPITAENQAVLTAFIDQLSAAREAARLRSEAERLEALGRTNALRSALLQAVSHDLRTPLASIKASATGLLRADVEFSEADRTSLLTTIDRSTDRLDRIVGNLLDMSRIQAGSLDPTTRPTALEEVVAAALGQLPASDSVIVDVPATVPLVAVDAQLLERALANVISNAIAWSSPGPAVRIDAEAVAGRVVLRIVDRGPGIPPADRERVFEPFQRFGDRSNDAGVGLGLAIARGFTTAIGGTLTLDDTPGGGLTVTFGLPIAATP